MADYAVVPSEFTREWYWRTVGVHCHVLPYVVEPRAVVAPQRRPKYLTFVNPQTTKGVTVFARIAAELGRRRTGIPLLVMESRGRAADALAATGVDLSRANIRVLPNTDDPRELYALTRVLLMPSLWNESFGLVAAEALANGVPVIASDRGALPEIVGDAAIVLPIASHFTPDQKMAPTAADVEPWLAAILQLWDDPKLMTELSLRGQERARRWEPAAVVPQLREFFRSVRHQPGPPFVPPGTNVLIDQLG